MKTRIQGIKWAQNTGLRKSIFFWILSVSVSEFDIMILGMIVVAITAATSLLTIYFLGKASGGSDFGEEVLTNSTIESEVKKNVSSWFYFDFENRNLALLIILTCGLLLFIVSVGCCLFFVAVLALVVEDAREQEKIFVENVIMQIDVKSIMEMEIIQQKS